MKRDILLCIAVALSIVASYAAYVVVHAKRSDIYFLYVHVPAALICFLAFSISLIASILYLWKRREEYDRIAEVSAILGLVYGAVALIAGSIWASVGVEQGGWGAYWEWDPKQTTMLILWIAYMGYISIKISIGSIEKKRVIGAVYNILAFSIIPLCYLSATLPGSHHIAAKEFSPTFSIIVTLLLNFIAAILLFIYLLMVMSTVSSLEENVNALMYESGGARYD